MECVVKRVKIFITLKKRRVWVFYSRGERDDANETGLKEGGGIRNVDYSAPFACRSIRLNTYLVIASFVERFEEN